MSFSFFSIPPIWYLILPSHCDSTHFLLCFNHFCFICTIHHFLWILVLLVPHLCAFIQTIIYSISSLFVIATHLCMVISECPLGFFTLPTSVTNFFEHVWNIRNKWLNKMHFVFSFYTVHCHVAGVDEVPFWRLQLNGTWQTYGIWYHVKLGHECHLLAGFGTNTWRRLLGFLKTNFESGCPCHLLAGFGTYMRRHLLGFIKTIIVEVNAHSIYW